MRKFWIIISLALIFTSLSAEEKVIKKQPLKAAALSCFIPGGGQLYNGKFIKSGFVLAVEGSFIGLATYHHLEAEKYYDKYSNMSPYQLYCELYKQHYVKPGIDEEGFYDEDFEFEIPPKLSRSKFEELKSEYLYLDRKTMFGDANDAEFERYFELRDLLFGDIIF